MDGNAQVRAEEHSDTHTQTYKHTEIYANPTLTPHSIEIET